MQLAVFLGLPGLLGLISSAASSAVLDTRAPSSRPKGYAPSVVVCPTARPTVRSASSLSPNEAAWRTLRREATRGPLRSFLAAAKIPGFDADTGLADEDLPIVGLAMSGGGYRALMNGAGFLAAADNRTPNGTTANTTSGIAGLLQASTYLAGLSGGGWLVSSIYANNFSSVMQLRDGYAHSDLWRFDNSMFLGPSDDAQDNGSDRRRGAINTAEYWRNIQMEVDAKSKLGFDTSLTDYWGRALSYQLINAPDGGPAYTFSALALDDDLAQGRTPLPLLVADGRAPNTTAVTLNGTTVFEFSPFELGSWDPTTYGFVPLAYAGSDFNDGIIPDHGHCMQGFDQLGFVLGTSSTLFNAFMFNNVTESASAYGIPDFVVKIIEGLLKDLDSDNNDIAPWTPNPFKDYRPGTNPFAAVSQLTLVDGGEDLQNIPIHPLLQPVRAVDAIVAVDSSADTDHYWPNGTALRAAYERATSNPALANGTRFPAVPDDHTFINLGLNLRPTFFGCDATNFSGPGPIPPLVVYLPNAPLSAWSNVSTFDPSYSLSQRNDIIQNGFNVATRSNSTLDFEWPACLACALIARSLARTNTSVPSGCTTCFSRYCWDGSLNTTNYGPYTPSLLHPNGSISTSQSDDANSTAHHLGTTCNPFAAAFLSALLLLWAV